MSLKETLKRPIAGASGAAGALLGVFHFDVIAVLLSWGWTNLDTVFYMATLLVNSAPVLPVSEQQVAVLLAVLAALLLLKLVLRAREQVDDQLEEES